MMTKEVKAEEWENFCEQFTRLLHGSLVDVAMHERDGSRRDLFQGSPLKGIVFRTDDPCSDIIELRLGQPEETGGIHTIIEPIHVKLREPQEGRKILEIEAENGTTLVHFHCGQIGKALAELHLEG